MLKVRVGRPLLLALCLAVALVAACSADGTRVRATPHPAPLTVASFNFPESELIAEIYAQALEHAGVPVRRELDLGPRELVQPAQHQHLVDLVPEYLGTALTSVDPHTRVDLRRPAAVLAALHARLAPWGVVPLRPAAASDQNAFAVTPATAARLHLRTVSDLARVRGRLVLGGPSECPVRPTCLVGLRGVYHVPVSRFVAFDDAAQRRSALAQGVVDVAVAFTTDGAVAAGQEVLLRDDRQLQPAEQVVPVITQTALARFGARVSEALDAVSARLDTASLRFLNWRLSAPGTTVRDEAHGWLARHGLLRGT